ncbi:hypothetical protein LJR129_005109 [Acidovorax sp. LjRoot129]|uniref:cation efflux protein, CzcI family n=1 Tax=Acidovorax sp. LjRoot129 TaxID=3342260 RepID=UPI003ECFD21F
MRRLIAVFMLALLPFQFSWSAVAAYCMHENETAQAQHLGHHEHNHDAKGGFDKAGQGSDQFDIDCSVCHGAGVGALSWSCTEQSIVRDILLESTPAERLAAVTPTPPDRPQWSLLA